MLRINIPISEHYDEETEKFVTQTVSVDLEHSLASLSKWESKWKKPFLSDDEKTDEQTLDYIRMMVLNDDFPEDIFQKLSMENVKQINEYIEDKMTATWFKQQPESRTKPIITSEIIYYWMVSLNIPFECENWHLNRLITLVRVCDEKNKPPEKQDPQAMAAQRKAVNDARRAKYKTKG